MATIRLRPTLARIRGKTCCDSTSWALKPPFQIVGEQVEASRMGRFRLPKVAILCMKKYPVDLGKVPENIPMIPTLSETRYHHSFVSNTSVIAESPPIPTLGQTRVTILLISSIHAAPWIVICAPKLINRRSVGHARSLAPSATPVSRPRCL